MTGYQESIVRAVGCDEREARVVEQIMRAERPTLDALSRRAFDGLARRSKRDLDTLRDATDVPDVAEIIAFYERQAGV